MLPRRRPHPSNRSADRVIGSKIHTITVLFRPLRSLVNIPVSIRMFISLRIYYFGYKELCPNLIIMLQ